ncbi:Uncharacterised protein [Clostridium paraputrificum]|uniref:Uncharacterized protein n=1 Tax=Clostridium paraputrificum TaxID=29363 RepID=A0A6N3EWQ2_9CLOT
MKKLSNTKNLDKFFNIWSDLDKSYEELGPALNVKSKRDFLKKLCYTNTGDSLIQKIKLLLKSEIDGYTEEDSEKYSILIEILDSVSLFLEKTPNLDVIEIDNLNTICMQALVAKKEVTTEKKITLDELEESFNCNPVINYLTTEELFKSYGVTNSTCMKYRNKTILLRLDEDFENDMITVDSTNLAKFVAKIKTGNVTPLLAKALQVVNIAMNNKYDLSKGLTFCNAELLVGNKLYTRIVTHGKSILGQDVVVHKSNKVILL